jgi:hypothetical protein
MNDNDDLIRTCHVCNEPTNRYLAFNDADEGMVFTCIDCWSKGLGHEFRQRPKPQETQH